MLAFERKIQEVFDGEAKGSKADHARERAECARMTAAEIMKQDMARTNGVAVANSDAGTGTVSTQY